MSSPLHASSSWFPFTASSWRRLLGGGPAVVAGLAALLVGLLPAESRAQGAMVNGSTYTGLISVAGEVDTWTFDAVAGGQIVVGIGEVGGDSALFPHIRLLGPNGAQIGVASHVHATRISEPATLSGSYTVEVSSTNSGSAATGDYAITAVVTSGDPVVSPGDQGGPLTNGANHAGDLYVGDVDQWTFTATAGARMVVAVGEVGGDTPALVTQVLVYGPDGQLVTHSSANEAAQAIGTAMVSGRHTAVVVSGAGATDGAGDYLITLAMVPGSPPVVSAGDEGGVLTNNIPMPGLLHVGDLDQWTFAAAAGATVEVTVTKVSGTPDLLLAFDLDAPDGTRVTFASDPVTAQNSHAVPVTGVYTVVVSTTDGGYDGTGAYTVRVVGALDPSDLQITKSVATTDVEPGGAVAYTLVATNLGPAVANAVVVTDVLPAGLTFVSCTAPGGTCGGSGQTRTITYAALAPGQSQTITLVATVTAAHGASIVNTATIGGAVSDPQSGNNAAAVEIFVIDDGLPNAWEEQFGLDPNTSGTDDGATGDPDHDGKTNAQEHADGTHPRGFFQRFLAEGAVNAFFDVRLALLNVGTRDAKLLRRYLQPGGAVVSKFEVLAAGRRRTLTRDDLTDLTSPDFSTVVESDQPIVFDRTMTWGGGYGSHAESGVPDAATVWYLAEGSTSGPFELFYLIQNPNPSPVVATVRYLLPFGQAPIVRTYSLPANSRTTLPIDAQGPELANTDVSAEISAPAPIIVERAMYRSSPTVPFAAGHGSAGVTAAASNWFLAEGATGPFFDCFILLANPQTEAASVTVNYLLSDGRTFTKAYVVPAQGRYTIFVDAEEIPGGSGQRPLDNVAVSSTITANRPIIVERTMWWPSPASSADYWTEAHNSPGATATGTRWAMAEGELGGPQHADTYILIANTSAFADTVRVTLYFEDGTSLQKTVIVLPNSRRNVDVATEFPQAANRRFGATVDSLGTPAAQIVVERAMYTSPGGAVWSAGTNALGANLTPR